MLKKILLLFAGVAFFMGLTGFNTDNTLVPREEILSGGPPKDGIPALLKPSFVPAREVRFLKDDDQIIGVSIGDMARAYPIRILNWHEAVNDTLNGQPIVVTF